MEVADLIGGLRQEGELMAKAAAAVEPDAPIPTCPEWVMRDLVLHAGQVHRWATLHVVELLTERAEASAVVGPAPGDDRIVDWFREGHQTLVEALESAEPDLECWSFLAAPSPLAFWARRQCHETGIHRADAESASGPISAFPAAIAADGVDELLCGFVTRPGGRLESDVPRALLVQTADTGDEWLVRISDTVETERSGGAADCMLRGSASDVHLLLWNRSDTSAVDVKGDASLLDLWRDSVTIRWR
ncbi:MAG: hypothetical protein QOC92_2097 [Acidimicrobiaceae bacterium]